MIFMDYDKLFENALDHVLEAYSESRIRFISERDLQAHLFFECRRLMEERKFPLPLKLYAEKSVFNKRQKVDLVLGDDEILVELKLDPDYPGVSKPVVFSTNREGSNSVQSDLEKIAGYAGRGKCAHFVMIDEDGRHVCKLNKEPWKSIYVKLNGPKKLSQYLQVKRDGRK